MYCVALVCFLYRVVSSDLEWVNQPSFFYHHSMQNLPPLMERKYTDIFMLHSIYDLPPVALISVVHMLFCKITFSSICDLQMCLYSQMFGIL